MKHPLKHVMVASALLATLAMPAFAERPAGMGMAMGPFAGLAQAKPQLKLSTEQAALWTAAENATRSHRETMKAAMEKSRSLIDEQKAQPILDLQKINDMLEGQRNEARALHDKERDAWLKAYASLNNEQKQTASEFIKRHWQKMHDRRGKHRGPGGPGEQGPGPR
ncbi:MAG: hypothetical protein RL210_2695 [Pseudomonadota bacterium]|jgi:Spy/CpxP family protein refolding chaperone